MDQVKIGKFIAKRRKNVGLTQLQLAERLNLTDRAVSKWETGRAMPDYSIMLELCNILKITVNDLLRGEMVAPEDYNDELETRLLEMVKEKQLGDKRLLRFEIVIVALSLTVLFMPIIIGSMPQIAFLDWQRLVVVFSGFIPALVGILFAIRIEQVVGHYECKKCGHLYVPTYKSMTLALHMGRTRYMKCPNCKKRSWQKKMISQK